MNRAKLNHALAAGLLLLLLFLMAGCAVGVSHFERSWETADVFEKGQLLEDHQYYYFGHPFSPDAVVAIRDGYELTSPKWQAVQPDPRQLKTWVERMLNQPGAEYNPFANGAKISNDHREVIGAWYSVWQLPVLEFTDKTAFNISDPVSIFPIGNMEPPDRYMK